MVWCDLWQWIAQSPGYVGVELVGAHGADRDVDRDLRPARLRPHPAAVGAGHLEVVAVHVDRMVGHGEVADAHPHAVALGDHQRI